MKIAVLGAGNIGGSLAKHWAQAGHQIALGVRDPNKAEVQNLIRQLGSGARATSLQESVADADAILFAVPGAAVEETAGALGKALSGKVVIDATNNRGGSGFNNVDKISAAAPDAVVYRAFNTYGFENLAEPGYHGEKADIFYAGPDGEPQRAVEQLIADAGHRPVRLGGIDQVPVVDSIVLFWFALAGSQGGRHVALKMVN
jgi:8-hydroxy-5-deazaflavin:NADPH oxidoreductase